MDRGRKTWGGKIGITWESCIPAVGVDEDKEYTFLRTSEFEVAHTPRLDRTAQHLHTLPVACIPDPGEGAAPRPRNPAVPYDGGGAEHHAEPVVTGPQEEALQLQLEHLLSGLSVLHAPRLPRGGRYR